MVLKEGPLIGSIGLMVSQADQHAEMGYWVGKEYWNRGFCTEAAKAVLEYAFETLRLEPHVRQLHGSQSGIRAGLRKNWHAN